MRKYKIPKEDRKAWLEALESEKYKQCSTFLYNSKENSYCCLGVFGKIKNIPDRDMEFICLPIDLFNEERQLYPKCLLGKGDRSFVRKLSKMNDDGASFKKIAKYIRKHTVGV